ncbi:hypothetical protein NPIL_115301 [Nephila pilipes]|uniref:Uncharacterized protein n=1 Tax=Nephila pilipes TaxID=299642 RepID=A0A8X6TWA0_NEPPI|nr:hypothetical protein NPIL_115301 [Nephila pilipes]
MGSKYVSLSVRKYGAKPKCSASKEEAVPTMPNDSIRVTAIYLIRMYGKTTYSKSDNQTWSHLKFMKQVESLYIKTYSGEHRKEQSLVMAHKSQKASKFKQGDFKSS